MQYRVRFKFLGIGTFYYTEWFDTSAEAVQFTAHADESGRVLIIGIEDSNGETFNF